MKSCDANLVTLAPNMHLENTIPGKVYEALGICRPVIAVVPTGSSCWNLVKQFEDVLTVDSADVNAYRQDLIERITVGSVDARRDGIEKYSWKYLASSYDDLLTELSQT